jgi:large subunit ribosomal protein L3
MTQVFDKNGRVVPVTAIEAGPCPILQVKTADSDGYVAVQLGFGKMKHACKAAVGHSAKAKVSDAPKNLREFRLKSLEGLSQGAVLKADIFKAGDKVEVIGTSIGKGTTGTVKRWHFHRGPMSHGSKCHRLPGSIGAGTTPGRVEKGTRMSGRVGNARVTVKNLLVVDVNAEKNLILVRGAIPGPKSGIVLIRKIS